jgi:hypothetical protein
MLSRSFEAHSDDESGHLSDVSERSRPRPEQSLQDDVEQLLDIAGQLFSAIERQIHRIEDNLGFTYGERAQVYAETVFKERLIHCAESLDASIQEIGRHLERRASEHIVNYGLRDTSPI